MSTEIVPLAFVVLILVCLAYPVFGGCLMLGAFCWGVLACFFPRLRI